ncbi:hypothetical protein N7510_000249 [Penicillium lagena]|uniref:uncharacterized protein n=1 Tax=Penicillium lagena TaxID=94218 RepID=UPI002541399A|nr:uncharacterized protein N7510_000249 [Penicillium lagena]KAJ5623940.1 hypothetical protein N7510_000249 [Penicillium lagena]
MKKPRVKTTGIMLQKRKEEDKIKPPQQREPRRLGLGSGTTTLALGGSVIGRLGLRGGLLARPAPGGGGLGSGRDIVITLSDLSVLVSVRNSITTLLQSTNVLLDAFGGAFCHSSVLA